MSAEDAPQAAETAVTSDAAPPVTTDARATSQGYVEGIALVHRAQDSGDWRPVVAWLARHPECAEEFARAVNLEEQLKGAIARPASYADFTGTNLDGYELHEIIGKGGTGVVFRGYDPGLRREVAVKIVHGDADRFQFEAQAVARLEHENIVPVYDFGETERGPYLVMQLMVGSLEEYRKSRPGGRLAPTEAARLVRDVARGVHHAHQRGLIHRDLKPLNVLLDESRTPRIADFGLARQLDVTAQTEGIAGTFAYMAPEQARGEKGLTVAVDVHALGATLFELLTGRLPFGGGASAIQRVLKEAPPPLRQFAPEVNKDLEAVCLKCMEKEPGSRYATALEVAEELDRYLRGEPVQARPPGFWDWLRQLARTRPEPNENYSWPVVFWFGAIVLAANIAIFAMVRLDVPALGVWLANGLCAVGMAFVLWWYMLRRFRQLPVTERHSLINATGQILLYLPLLIAYVPFSSTAPAREALAIYPPLAALGGLGIFMLGSTNWSRFFPIGIGMMALVPVLNWYPESSPLVFGAVTAVIMWYWGATKSGFGRAAIPLW
jgi:serine/threonine-protein kinase